MLMPNEPTGIAVSKDGATLYVTCASDRWPNGVVCVVSVATGKVTRRIAAGHMARSPVLSADGATLYVCNWLGDDLSVITIASGTETRIRVEREPYAAAITPDGATLVVTNSLPSEKATDTVSITGKVSLISTATKTVRATIPVYPAGTHSLFGVSISPDGKYALATHLVGLFTIPSTKLEGGWVHTNNLAIIDIASGKLVNDIMLDNAQQGFANPWGLGCTGDGKFLCVLHAGSNTMTIIDYPQLMVKALAGKSLSHDFTAIYGIKSVANLSTKGSRAIAMIGNRAYVAGYFSDSIQVIAVSGLTSTQSTLYPLGPNKPMNGERQGNFNYTNASNCFQQWQSCFSCHPFYRPDALNWILNTTNSTPKNVKSAVYAWWTPPNSWAGKRPHAGGPDGSIRSGLSAELFIQPTEAVAAPLDTFFMRLKPVASRFLVKGRLSTKAARGGALFESIGCGACHPAPLYTDQRFHNAGVIDNFDPNTQWDTPSLIEAWRTAPYSHLGIYDSIQQIIKLRAHSLGAQNLTPQEMSDLIEFVSSL
jgi:DNA-binding beta-propeller fold protein YncE